MSKPIHLKLKNAAVFPNLIGRFMLQFKQHASARQEVLVMEWCVTCVSQQYKSIDSDIFFFFLSLSYDLSRGLWLSLIVGNCRTRLSVGYQPHSSVASLPAVHFHIPCEMDMITSLKEALNHITEKRVYNWLLILCHMAFDVAYEGMYLHEKLRLFD